MESSGSGSAEVRSPVSILSGMTFGELEEFVSPEPRFRAKQIFSWIASGATTFDEMANLPLALRKRLSKTCLTRPQTEVTRHDAKDGTLKFTVGFSDGGKIESVLLADSSRGADVRYTACISTQVGCPSGCVFCKTGTMGFIRNLTSAEIVEQFLLLETEAKAKAVAAGSGLEVREHPISNIVVMGMGEPFMNLPQLRRALEIIGDGRGLNFSKRRVTVSTCGIVPGIIDLADNGPGVRLAISLTTGDEDLRRRLMPITRAFSLDELKAAIRRFQDSGGGRVTLEAALLGGVNTREKDALGIAAFVEGLDATVNLIPWNPVKGLEFEGKAIKEPPLSEVEAFERRLKSLGLNVTRRFRRGRGIMGACGQLATATGVEG